MELWMLGVGLAALLALGARDVARRGDATAEGLMGLRVIGGTGLGAMALLALAGGSPVAAGVAALGALPLAGGLAAPLVRRLRARAAAPRPQTRVIPDPRFAAPAEERRAA